MTIKMKILVLFCFASLISCNSNPYTYLLNVKPEGASIFVDGQLYTGNKTLKSKQKEISVEAVHEGYQTQNQKVIFDKKNKVMAVDIILQPVMYQVSISSLYNVFPSTKGLVQDFKISIDGTQVNAKPYYNNYAVHPNWIGEGLTFEGKLSHGVHQIRFSAKNYPDYVFPVSVTGPQTLLIRHPQVFTQGALEIIPLGVYDCGKSPKQADISPDGKFIYIALLDEYGFQVFDVEKKQIVAYIKPEGYSKYLGFVEGLFIPSYNAYFVSQMTSASIFEYDVKDLSAPVFRRRIPVQGDWSKVIAYDKKQNILAVSNWVSNDVSIIDYTSGSVIKKISGLKEPRGLIFSNDGRYLYITTYAGGGIYKYNTSTWTAEGSILVANSSMRHARITNDDKILYINDMALSKMHKIDTATFKIISTINTDIYPNTFDLTEDEKFIFVSNRGPNNPASYLQKSLEPGFIDIIDTATFTVTGRITGGTQPTGLDISADGKLLVLSNFQDHTIELFSIGYPAKK